MFNIGYANVPQCYVISTLRVLFNTFVFPLNQLSKLLLR
jgi:hypothetical protein